jgi:PPOX class probable F420-dependent enzyme
VDGRTVTRYSRGVALRDEKFMLLTSFRRNGTPVATPVWVVGLDGEQVAFYTSSGSGKAKRLSHTARVTVQPCNARGRVKPGSQPVEATARLVSGSELEAIRTRVVAKYGVVARFTKLGAKLIGTLRGKRIPYADRGVIVTPGPSAP